MLRASIVVRVRHIPPFGVGVGIRVRVWVRVRIGVRAGDSVAAQRGLARFDRADKNRAASGHRGGRNVCHGVRLLYQQTIEDMAPVLIVLIGKQLTQKGTNRPRNFFRSFLSPPAMIEILISHVGRHNWRSDSRVQRGAEVGL